MEIIIYNIRKEPTIIITNEDEIIIMILIKLHEIIGIDIETIKLIYHNQELDHNKTIKFYGIKNNDFLFIVKK